MEKEYTEEEIKKQTESAAMSKNGRCLLNSEKSEDDNYNYYIYYYRTKEGNVIKKNTKKPKSKKNKQIENIQINNQPEIKNEQIEYTEDKQIIQTENIKIEQTENIKDEVEQINKQIIWFQI